MTFAHDTDSALASTAALVCTLGPPDSLTTVADLEQFISSWEYSGRFDRTEEELWSVRELRSQLRLLWDADLDTCVHLVNDLLERADARPYLARHDDWGWHIHATRPEQPLAERLAVEAAMALVDVIRSEQTDRFKICANPDCQGVLVDLSRNRSRQYCGVACGNRMHVAAYRARQTE